MKGSRDLLPLFFSLRTNAGGASGWFRVDEVTAMTGGRDVAVGPTGYWVRLDHSPSAPVVGLGYRPAPATSLRVRLTRLTEGSARPETRSLTFTFSSEGNAPTAAATLFRWDGTALGLEVDLTAAPASRLPVMIPPPRTPRAKIAKLGPENVPLPAVPPGPTPSGYWVAPNLAGIPVALPASAGPQGWLLGIATTDRVVTPWVSGGTPLRVPATLTLPASLEVGPKSLWAFARTGDALERPQLVAFPRTADMPYATARTAPPLGKVPPPKGQERQGPARQGPSK